MGLLTTLAKSYLNLNETDRHTIFKLFGSFKANKFADNPTQLIQNGYESNVDVYAVIKKLTDVFLDVPYVIERRTSDGWELLEDSTLHELMEKPNVGKGYTWNDIDEQLLIYLLASGNGYLVGQTGFSSRYDEVDVLPSPFVEVQTNNDFFMPNARFQFELNTNRRVYDQEEIEHIKFFNPSYCTVQESYCGLSIIQVAAMAVQVGNDRWSADANLLQNRGAIGLITDKSNRPMTPEEAARVQAGFQKRNAGTENFGKVTVTNKDLNFISMAMNSTDLQLVEKGVVNLRAICNVFGLDSSLFNDPANKTFNNRKEAEKAMYTNAIMPIAEKVMAKHNQYLALNHYPDGSVRLRKDFSGVEALQQDKKMEAEKDKIVLDGLNTILSMPVSNDSKKILIQDTYPEMSEEFVDSLMVEITE
jgi:HK97 family phage portal protein